MDETIQRFVHDLISRPSGPLGMRFLVQPIVATLLAVKAGIDDAKRGDPPFLMTAVTRPELRSSLFKSAWEDIGKVFALAIALDLIFGVVELKGIYPLETLTVAFVLAFLPYLVARGPSNRLMRRHLERKMHPHRA